MKRAELSFPQPLDEGVTVFCSRCGKRFKVSKVWPVSVHGTLRIEVESCQQCEEENSRRGDRPGKHSGE